MLINMKKQRFLVVLSAFLLSINCIFSSTITAYATGYSRADLEDWNDWTFLEKFDFYNQRVLDWIGACCGVFLSGNSTALLQTYLRTCWDDLTVENMSYEEWIASKLGYDIETEELTCDDELVDLMYIATTEYIEEETGWYNITTSGLSTISMTNFATPEQYTAFKNYLSDNPQTIVFNVGYRTYYQYVDDEGNIVNGYESHEDGTAIKYTYFCYFKSEAEFYVNLYKSYSGYSWYNLFPTINWVNDYQYIIYIDESGEIVSDINTGINRYMVYINDDGSTNFTYPYYSEGRKVFRAYKSLEDLKTYSVGNRPYYMTDKFQDYDINGDNSCILSESDLQNSSVYGDVQNYITNNYDNPDGLTEQELIDILNDYFGNLDLDSGGSGSGSNNSGGSGLSGFLSGIGSIGDAILSILGKLLEYVGKALDLLSNTATKVIDLVPKNITNLLGGLFPFLPQEWLTAIELSLVLAVIIGIVGIFKK